VSDSRSGKKREGLSSLASLMPRAYPSMEPDDVAALRAFAWWSRAVPERVAKNARPVRLHNGVLLVHTSSSAWAHDLSFLRDQILKAIQTSAPHAGIRDMRIQVGPLPAVPPRTRDLSVPDPIVPLETVPSEIAASLAHVHDDALRESIAYAAKISLAPRPAKSKQKK
jgi:hypothetical protein